MQYRLRTLMIVLAVGPVVLAGTWFAVVEVSRSPVLQQMLVALLCVAFALLCYGVFAVGLGLATARVIDTTIDWMIRFIRR